MPHPSASLCPSCHMRGEGSIPVHERKEGDEGGPNIGLEPGGKEVPGRGDLGDPDALYSWGANGSEEWKK